MNSPGYHGGETLFGQSHPDPGFMGSGAAPSGRPAAVPPLSSSFGFPPPGVESSVIESISTGTGDIGGSSLWGSSDVLSGSGPEVASSLLSHLIGESGKDNKLRPDSLLGQGSTDEDARRNSHSIW